ncbi:MAG: glycoside hydrolase family 15 protein [Bacteriovoracaceae bacterium]|nr:glycoside hydrolase family 15 protein [Bacteriovoracaceae bacterium]
MSWPIENYALLSNCHSAALVGKDGSIDWLCCPCFDSQAFFSALLGTNENGRWLISPQGEYKSTRNYIEDTMVLETYFETPQGSCKITDCMLIEETPTLIRSVQGISGEVDIEMELIIRFDYGSIIPWVRRNKNDDGIHAVAGPEGLVIYSPVHLHGENLHTKANFKCIPESEHSFVLRWYPSHQSIPSPIRNPQKSILKTINWWKKWANKNKYQGFDRPAVMRSLITLKGLTYKPTGAVVAAATTSLPETLGGIRNWDYRYGWIRDSSLTLMVLLRAGYLEEAIRWNEWLLRAVAGTPSQLNIMYGIRAERRLTEIELDWLPGYENSRPVRIGNAAYEQFQLDVFGELIASAYIGRTFGIPINENAWKIESELINYVCEHWQEPDEGIWEVRGIRRQFTHSKLMAWVALNYAVESVHQFGLPGRVEYWKEIRDKIHQDICTKGFNKKLNSFVQFYGSEELDASLLMMSLVNFLPITDPRIVGTVEAIQKYLMKDGLLLRYIPHSDIDGLQGKEGSFLACSFWLVRNLNLMGRNDEAMELYQRLLSLRNDVGLFAEEFSTLHNRMVGNFPQAFSHIGQIGAAMSFKAS